MFGAGQEIDGKEVNGGDVEMEENDLQPQAGPSYTSYHPAGPSVSASGGSSKRKRTEISNTK